MHYLVVRYTRALWALVQPTRDTPQYPLNNIIVLLISHSHSEGVYCISFRSPMVTIHFRPLTQNTQIKTESYMYFILLCPTSMTVTR